MDEYSDDLTNVCTDLVALTEYEMFVYRLLTQYDAGVWVRVETLSSLLNSPPDGIAPRLFVSWLQDPLSDDNYVIIVFYEDESKWSMGAHYNRSRLLSKCSGREA